MIALQDPHDRLLCSAATRLTGWERRLFIGEVTLQLCDGNARRSERRFGWGRETARKGLEQWQGVWHEDNYSVRGLSLIHISEPTRLGMISYAVFCLKKKKKTQQVR